MSEVLEAPTKGVRYRDKSGSVLKVVSITESEIRVQRGGRNELLRTTKEGWAQFVRENGVKPYSFQRIDE